MEPAIHTKRGTAPLRRFWKHSIVANERHENVLVAARCRAANIVKKGRPKPPRSHACRALSDSMLVRSSPAKYCLWPTDKVFKTRS
jgi:hypothetical protein